MNIALRAALLALALCAPGWACAQAYPGKPIKIITGYTPGGVGGVVTRLYADQLSKRLGQAVVVEDRPGASNSIGARAVMTAAPDGYTLHMGGLNAHPALFKNGIDLSKEMEPVGLAASIPLAFITSTAHPFKTVADVAAFAKANPGVLNFASSGGSAAVNLMMTLLADRAGKFTYIHVPFKGTSEILTALSRGDIHLTLLSASSIMPAIQSGKARAIVIGGPTRSSMLPDVPTLTEAGIKPFATDTLLALWAPHGTPAEIIRKLSEASMAVARDPAYIEALKSATGVTPVALTPQETRKLYQEAVADLDEASRLAKYRPE